jgi:hypothetical protein
VRRLILRSLLVLLTTLAGAGPALAQGWRGFATAGIGSIDYGPGNRQSIGQFSGGALFTIGNGPLAVGGQGDLFTDNGYFSGRGGFLAELTPIRRGQVRPFANGGFFYGDGGALWIVGGGVEMPFTERVAFRFFAQDGFRRSTVSGPFGGQSRTIHEPSFQFGVGWR